MSQERKLRQEINYFSDGVTVEAIRWLNDEKLAQGGAIYFNNDGSINMMGRFKDGKKDGEWRWCTDNQITETHEYRQGEQVFFEGIDPADYVDEYRIDDGFGDVLGYYD